MRKFVDVLKDIAETFYLKYVVVFFLAGCFGFGVVGPLLHQIDENRKEEAVATSASKKKLPIYCVGTDKKNVAISFDAAWAKITLLED